MNHLQNKEHPRVCAYIDLSAIEENINQIHEKIAPDTKMIAVIKADGYGHGALPIARICENREDVWGYGVATAEEARELREQNIQKPILILGYTFREHYEMLCRNEVRMTCFTLEMAKEMSDAAIQCKKTAYVHLALDTGMTRIGFPLTEDVFAICQQIASLPGLEVEGIFTHFSKADEWDLTYMQLQWKRYQEFCSRLEELGMLIPCHHCCNSAGIMNLYEGNLNLVRPGIILYGIYPSNEVKKEGLPLKQALTLKSHVVHVKEVEAGIPISYGGTFITPHKMRIATIPVGYGDGYPRSLSNKGYVLIHGKRASILGRVCMDQFMVDVTEIPDVKVRDEVTLTGKEQEEFLSIETLGEMSGRFPYEFVCDLGKRIPRVYIRE